MSASRAVFARMCASYCPYCGRRAIPGWIVCRQHSQLVQLDPFLNTNKQGRPLTVAGNATGPNGKDSR